MTTPANNPLLFNVLKLVRCSLASTFVISNVVVFYFCCKVIIIVYEILK